MMFLVSELLSKLTTIHDPGVVVTRTMPHSTICTFWHDFCSCVVVSEGEPKSPVIGPYRVHHEYALQSAKRSVPCLPLLVADQQTPV
jgi:hypothetical protein